MFLVCVWVDKPTDDLQFESSIPLLFLGKWLCDNKSKEEFHILFLYGKRLLSDDYYQQLKRIENYKIFSYDNEYLECCRQYQSILKFGQYESNCFLRWFIIQNHLQKNRIDGHVIHMDGDIMFNASPKEILNDMTNSTFVLQGCPGFVTICNHLWFENFKKEFSVFTKNIESYSQSAWRERLGWEVSHKLKWAGSRFRKIISSDQDMISHLIHTNRIPQDDPKKFCDKSTLYYAENPLYIHSHAQIQVDKVNNLHFSTHQNCCYIENKKIAIWHFQSNFVKYLRHFLVLNSMHYSFKVPNQLETSLSFKLLLKLINRHTNFSRLQIYSQVLEFNRDDRINGFNFSDVFNKKRFWKKGAFSN